MRRKGGYAGGFSLLEALMVVALLGVVSALLVPRITGPPDAAKRAKLEQDVVIVNNAIDSYLAAGGSQGALNADNVIEALKQRIAGGVTAEMTGAVGPFLDPRVVTFPSDFSWSARFETSPRPRFVVQNSPEGVVFGKGLPSPVGGPTASANPSWLWSYSPATAAAPERPIYEPGIADSDSGLGTTNTVLTGLAKPVITPGSQTLPLTGYPLAVNVSNPNPQGSSIVYYRIGSGSWVLSVGTPFNVDPGSTVTAVAISLDPSRYYNSGAADESYQVVPWQLAVDVSAPSGVTYAQAGGQMSGQALMAPVTATISIANAGQIPAPYVSSSYFSVRYTTDGSDPSTSATAQSSSSFSGSFPALQLGLGLAAWGSSSAVTIRAVAVSAKPEWFSGSAVSEATSTKTLTPLSLGVSPANPIGLPVQLLVNESGSVPVGLRKYYAIGGSDPLTSPNGGAPTGSAILYTGPVSGASLPSTSYVLTAQAAGPSGYESWFSSAPVSRTYSIVTSLPSGFVGANISGGDVNGTFRGSIFVSAPADLGIFNAGGQITGGNLYVPGLPAIEIPGSGNSTKTVVARGQPYTEQGQIPRTLVAGKEYTASGELAEPQLDTRQVVDLNGAVTPTNYTVKLTKSAYIEGKIYRRADAPPPPATPVVPSGLPVRSNTISGTFQTNLPAGVYSNLITMNSTNSVLRLGTPGSTTQYVFAGNTWNKGTVEVLGPVEVFFLSGFDNKGVAFGNSNNINSNSPTSLRINVMTNDVDITGGGSVYATMWAGTSAVTVGNASSFYGNIYAKTLTVSPGGTVNVE